MKPFTTIDETLEFLMQQLPMFTTQGKSALKPGLENIIKLCNFLGNPQNKFKSIHIAGTNGKGSTSHLIAAALQNAGYKTGLYTSPHLIDIRERIRIDGTMVEQQFVIDFVNRCLPIMEEIKPSYFELNVAMAFEAFAQEEVDIAVIEVGLGGRLDSTNIIHPLLAVITNISLDHTQILGDTRTLIAAEKAGIIKTHIPVVVGQKDEETQNVFLEKARSTDAPLQFAEDEWTIELLNTAIDFQEFKITGHNDSYEYLVKTDLMGTYQMMNVRTAFAACKALQQMGISVSDLSILNGFAAVKELTKLRGRWDIIQTKPFIILDVGHNPDGIKNVINQLKDWTDKSGKLYIIIGFVSDKDVATALKQFPKNAHYAFTQAQIPRAMSYDEVAKIGHQLDLFGNTYPTVNNAIEDILPKLTAQDTLLITGSFFIVGEAMSAKPIMHIIKNV